MGAFWGRYTITSHFIRCQISVVNHSDTVNLAGFRTDSNAISLRDEMTTRGHACRETVIFVADEPHTFIGGYCVRSNFAICNPGERLYVDVWIRQEKTAWWTLASCNSAKHVGYMSTNAIKDKSCYLTINSWNNDPLMFQPFYLRGKEKRYWSCSSWILLMTHGGSAFD